MKKLMIIAILAAVLLLVMPASAVPPNGRYPLFADKDLQVGNVTVALEGSPVKINITYILDGFWRMNESHAQVANYFSGLPQTKKENAIPGKFANSTDHDPPVSSYSYYQPKAPFTYNPLKIAAQADVWNEDTGEGAGAWAAESVGVHQFTADHKDWATYVHWSWT